MIRGEKFVCEDCDEEKSLNNFVGGCNSKHCIRRNLCDNCCINCEGCGRDFCTKHVTNVAEDDEDEYFLCQECKDGGK